MLSTRGLSCEDLQAEIDRVRDRLLQAPLHVPAARLRVNFSAGIASHRRGASAATLLDSADQALYAAKQAGRGRCVIADAQTPRPVSALERRSTAHAGA